MTTRLTIVKAGVPDVDGLGEVVLFAEVKTWLTPRRFLGRVLRYQDVRLRTQLLELLPKPLFSALLVRALSRGRCVMEDETGRVLTVGLQSVSTLIRSALEDLAARPGMMRRVAARLSAPPPRRGVNRAALDLSCPPLYLRTDLIFGLTSGGSVGHIAGVLNNLDAFTGRPIFVTTDPIPTTRPDIETWVIRPDGRYRDFSDLPAIAFNLSAADRIDARLASNRLAFVYQRYSLSNFTGAELAGRRNVPFVLEYNGSEVWIQRNWGRARLKYVDLAERIEAFNLDRSDVIVVVSDAMHEELVGRGIDRDKILVNPNGVDVERYRPDVDGSGVRQRLGYQDKIVVGFIGTFGPWHGAEVLAEAFVRLLHDAPALRPSVRLLMIGDGDRLAETQRIIREGGVAGETAFVGRTTQDEGIGYLAASDILVSPHVPNADGSRFFGSPTKLFEYMAMGRGIVASDLEQIGEVLQHDRTAWLVRPGDAEDLVAGMRTLIEDPARRSRLAASARTEVVAGHTWRDHTGRIVAKLRERCA